MYQSYRLPESGKEKKKVSVTFYFNGKELQGYEGEPIAAALLANGIRSIRTCENTGENRGVYCGIGHCYECRAEVNDISNVRTCLTPLENNMIISSQTSGKVGRNNNES